jgi:hypothetical protein
VRRIELATSIEKSCFDIQLKVRIKRPCNVHNIFSPFYLSLLSAISPASGSYNETAHTLRFAQRAQSVVNRPVVNEDPVARLIRDLRAEVARLKSLLSEKVIGRSGRQ